MISTRNLTHLPEPNVLSRLMQAFAMLDAILEEEWDNRYYSFNSRWSATEQMGSMRNGSGDDLFAVFDSLGCFMRGFDHESAMSPWSKNPTKVWPGILDDVPFQFESSLREPAFHMEDTTFCIWFITGDSSWSHGEIDFPKDEEDPDGSQWMLSVFDCKPETYQEFAKDYFELEVSLEAISLVYAQEPLSLELLQEFPSSRKFQEVIKDAEEIGYPVKP